jgi:alkylation response protein AidB-like acyl-CoA dehydrogenase
MTVEVRSYTSAVHELDRVLGHGAGAAFAPAALAELDHREEFPAAACRALDDFGLHRHYVPARHGGLLVDFAELMQLVRAVARRDLTVAVAHAKTLLGTASVWVGGRPEQAAWLAGEVAGGAVVSWGLTERHHGSDLLACELSARRAAGGWRLDGEKWLINNATRGDLMCVLARTRPEGGPRGFSLLLVDKRRLPTGSYQCLPKELTHGIRGADISGIALRDAPVPDDALVGEVGHGLEIVLKALQLTRTFSVALSLGAADHALRLAAGFARARHLYGRALVDLPRVRRVLGEAATGLLLAEATSVVAGRSAHALADEMSVVSAAVKAFVPTLVQEAIDALADLMGARGFLTGVYADGMFAKLERDHRIVGIFDGSTLVNRSALIDQFPKLARAYADGWWNVDGLSEATTLAAPLTPLDPARLRLLSPGGCSLVQSLPAAVGEIEALAACGRAPREVAAMADRLAGAADALHREVADYVPTPRDVPPAAFRLAERYEACFAGAACLRLWLDNAYDDPPALWRDARWLQACLTRVLGTLGGADAGGGAAYDAVADVLVESLDGTGVPGFSLLGTGGAP